ncbi:glutathione S-transferase [Pseudoduganella sp. FT25W]|jgi:glutathione S-transferase|uniref:Glutathione S-transferase n=1 Tax=Duganella alba TaxID=2666081 RepID=A0A6L5QA92_9BURK|nr:glutathione S-transferase family protein [Duganella alba]MRX06724.1 glutathione S-transferase [Duganella alba]MRX18474.1 glutathione S-transferase [Duganella alba]
MQTTKLDPSLTQTLEAARSPGLTLVIGNKNYSSWSMRPWVAMVAFGIPFQEVRVLLDREDTANRICSYSASGRVPVLLAGDEMTIWDSMAICEYLAEQFPELHLWPQDVAARAIARSVCAEMHAGFSDLRNSMSMNIRGSYPGKGRTPGTQADIGRISEIWEECLSRFGHHQFLFGEFSLADAFYAPVVLRFRTYGVTLAPALDAYCQRVLAHPAVARWVSEALAETETAPKHDADMPD